MSNTRIIKVKNWDEVEVEGALADSEAAFNRLKEQGVYTVHTDSVSFSHCPKEPSSKIINSSHSHIYGEAISAIDRGIERALALINNNETARVHLDIKGNYICESLTDEMVSISMDITLTIQECGKLPYHFSNEDKLQLGHKYKKLGVDVLAKESNFKSNVEAYLCFTKAIRWCVLINKEDIDKGKIDDLSKLKLQCYNNISQFHIYVKQYELAVMATNKVLEEDGSNVKALYRRGLAFTNLQEYEKAKKDLDEAVLLEPNNKIVKKQQTVLYTKMKALDKKYADAMRKFLG